VGVALAALLAAPAVASALPQAPPRQFSFLHVGSPSPSTGLPRIVDTQGRTVLLKGVNVDGIVDYWDADEAHPPPPDGLRPPYPSDPHRYANGRCPPDNKRVEGVVVCRFDFDQLRRLGYDVIRLNLSWSLLEPRPGAISARYVNRIAQIVRWARAAGIYVVLDMHQDAWSKFVYTRGEPCAGEFQRIRGFDGAPLWASQHASPACALHGVRELDPAVAEDFQKFWLNAAAPDGKGLQDHYTDVLVALAKRFKGNPAVVGYELMNEPQPGFNAAPGESDATEMFPYWGRAVDDVVKRVKGFRQLFFVEPNVERNVTDAREVPPLPWSTYSSYPDVVYAPHIYTGVFTYDEIVLQQRFQPMGAGYQATADDARSLGLPLWIGEFGNNPVDDDTLLRQHYALQDRYLLGGTLWLWKENANDTNPDFFWGVYGPPFGRGTPQPKRLLYTARATPLATAGTLQRVSYAPHGRTFEVRGQAKRVACGDRRHATVLWVPDGVRLAADGARLEVFRRGAGREVYAYPDGAGYRVFSGPGKTHRCDARRNPPRNPPLDGDSPEDQDRGELVLRHRVGHADRPDAPARR
jgi:endoglycosylceramidase